MHLTSTLIEEIIFNKYHNQPRFTQDSPIYPDVWMEYAGHLLDAKPYRADLILTPHRKSSAAELLTELYGSLMENHRRQEAEWQLASNGETVVANLTFDELLQVVMPITGWWQEHMKGGKKPSAIETWMMELIGALYVMKDKTHAGDDLRIEEWLTLFHQAFRQNIKIRKSNQTPVLLWSVSRNRGASITIDKSVPVTKADSSRKVFDVDGSDITWAILDTGIDATHPAFIKADPAGKLYKESMGAKDDPLSNHTRIVATYDFSRFRQILSDIHTYSKKTISKSMESVGISSDSTDKSLDSKKVADYIRQTEQDLKAGRLLDWSILAPLLRIPHNLPEYQRPKHPHGTHVAGILGANFCGNRREKARAGMCPNIQLYDLRVLDKDGVGTEFNILAALQFVRWMNSQKDVIIIHGINLSLSLYHEVASYGCGQTPICIACERLIAEGTIVVAAAGNQGQTIFANKNGTSEQGFRIVNITDPGNAEEVITVGSAHKEPHLYGVSYFSSKGPTGDGRSKPDIVAPGEKITSTVLDGNFDRMDGTSMAAPHVSGAAALLIARHRELIGRPRRVKQILCSTATDLGREKYFQGAGMVDVLRAIQSV